MASRRRPATGTLEEGQVRAMFDRIAGVYDLMNSVMTAGLHHRWRERAADLAALGPGDRALDVATGTGDLAIELARRVGPAGEVVGSDFSEGMLDARARKSDRGALGVGRRARAALRGRRLRRGDRRLRRAQLLRPRPRARRDGPRRAAGRPRRRARDHDAAEPPLSTFFSVWFDRVVPALGRLAGDPDAYAYLPNSVKRFPGPEALAGADGRRRA